MPRGEAMTRRFQAVVVALAVALPCLSPPIGAATVSGTVTIAGRGGSEEPAGIVWLEGVPGGAPEPGRAVIDMRKKAFRPGVVAVPVGSSVSFPNADPILHNVFSVSERNQFDLGLYGQGDGRTVVFREPGVVRVYCNVHPQMEAFVVVTPGPWWSSVAADGSFRIDGAPPGTYQIRVWDRQGGLDSRPVEVTGDGLVRVDFSLDASGYRKRPHLDKDGRPYTSRERY